MFWACAQLEPQLRSGELRQVGAEPPAGGLQVAAGER